MSAAPNSAVVRAVVVIRTAPEGFEPPYVLAVVEDDRGRALRRVETNAAAPPVPGDRVVAAGPDAVRPLVP